MIDAIIIDDEKPAIDVLKLLLEKTGQICVVGSFMNATDALSNLKSLKPDVAFLDIEMPEMSGLELAEKIIEEGVNIDIIFVTAYDKFALEAFRVNAIDYILKPLSDDDILRVITKLKKTRYLQTPLQTVSDKGRIYCFGRFQVYGAGCENSIRWRTSKAEELFAFFVTNLNTEVSKWVVTDALWPECGPEKLAVNLHTTIYQVKKSLLAANIKFEFSYISGKYKLELPEIYIDVAEFEIGTNVDHFLTEESIEKQKKALSLYKGSYLAEKGYSWSQNAANLYLIQYRSLVSKLTKYYLSRTDYISAEIILQEALYNEPLNDDFNVMMLELFFKKNNKASLIKHYNKIKELYSAELGITPNAAMQDLFYRTLKYL